MISPQPNIKLAKKLNVVAYVISAVVLLLVIYMRRADKIDIGGIDFSFLAPMHAIVNTLCAISLMLAVFFVKRKNIVMHRRMIYAAMFFSAMFLLSYVIYHFTTVETKYCGDSKLSYYFVLISHVVLAGVSLPFILLTFIRGYTGQVDKHRKMAKWVYPIWLYVSISGPIVFLMLSPCYGK